MTFDLTEWATRQEACRAQLQALAGWLVGEWRGEGVWAFMDGAPRTSDLRARWILDGDFLEVEERVCDEKGEVVHADRIVLQGMPEEGLLVAHHFHEGKAQALNASPDQGGLLFRARYTEGGTAWHFDRDGDAFTLRLGFKGDVGDGADIRFRYERA